MMRAKTRIVSLFLVMALILPVLPCSAYAANTGGASLAEIASSQAEGTGGTKYREWYYGKDNSNQWCAIFVSWCANQAGISETVIPRTAVCSTMRSKILANGGTNATDPQAGDLVFYYNNYTKKYVHVGIMINLTYSTQGNVGGHVANKMKPTSYLLSKEYSNRKNDTIEYIRPNYSGEITVGCVATTLQAERQSDGSYTLYGSASATGTYLKSVGMYIGTSSSNLQMPGQDSGGTNTSASMWYNIKKYVYQLQPGTTYYYRAYAATPSFSVVSTDIKSFTVPSAVTPSITWRRE